MVSSSVLLPLLGVSSVILVTMAPMILSIIIMIPAILIPIFLLKRAKTPRRIFKQAPYMHLSDEYRGQFTEGPFSSTDKTKVVPIRYSQKGIASEKEAPAVTIPTLLAMAAKKAPNKAAMRIERPTPPLGPNRKAPPALPLDQWKAWTWKQYHDECRTVARAFITLGLNPFDAVCIYGFNSPEWFMGQIGTILGGGIVAGIYPSDTADQVAYKASHSNSVVALVENNKKASIFLKKVNEGKIPSLKAIVVWSPSSSEPIDEEIPNSIAVRKWTDLKSIAEKTSDDELQKRIDALKPGNVCTYIYTSGTTGKPKAVMVTHDNIIWESACIQYLFNDQKIIFHEPGEERIISYLPLSHVAGLMVDIILPMITTARRPCTMASHFARPYDLKVGSIGDRLRAVQPSLFLGVPRVWEKISEKMMKVGAKKKGVLKALVKFAKEQGLKHGVNCQMGGDGTYPQIYPMAEILLDKVKQTLGFNNLKYALTSAAPIQKVTLEFFGALGIQINECYGMSECCGAVTCSTDLAHVWGSVGWTMPGCDIKIFKCEGDINEKKECPNAKDLFHPTEEEQGEICFRGRNIMAGYMANPALGDDHVEQIGKKNDAAIDKEGWLHSGDKGCMDSRGMIKITGRYKEIIIGAGGENIAPVPIENNIKKLCPAISNVMMLGDKKKFNVCFVTLSAKGATGVKPGSDELDGEALKVADGVTTISGAMKSSLFIDMITEAITKTNRNGSVCPSNASKIQKFSILPADFSVESNELTPTLKLKRSVVQKMHNELVDRMYSSKEVYIPFHG